MKIQPIALPGWRVAIMKPTSENVIPMAMTKSSKTKLSEGEPRANTSPATMRAAVRSSSPSPRRRAARALMGSPARASQGPP